ncbi:MAG TPA: hypothetical protein VGJ59_10770 [Jatrophihabitantaceae bacterium]
MNTDRTNVVSAKAASPSGAGSAIQPVGEPVRSVTDRVLGVVVRDVVDRQGPGPVGERHRRRAEQSAQMPDGPLPAVFGQALTQPRRGEARRMQCVERRAVGRGAQVPVAPAAGRLHRHGDDDDDPGRHQHAGYHWLGPVRVGKQFA